ncbi:MAG: hypothetical protein HY720_20795, partial [Planctomycetes bacterium]|nr:hypothetical protein [Planctomycetota bacterium]
MDGGLRLPEPFLLDELLGRVDLARRDEEPAVSQVLLRKGLALVDMEPEVCRLLGRDGGPPAEEKALLSEVASRLGVSAPVAAGAPLETVCAILLRSTALFCNDGGLLHLANALGVKTVSVFGPVDPRVYGPYGNQTPHEALAENV